MPRQPKARPTPSRPNSPASLTVTVTGTASEICEYIASQHNRPALREAAQLVAWDDSEHSLQGATLEKALAWLGATWPALASATHSADASATEPTVDPRCVEARTKFSTYVQLMWPQFELRPITKYLIAEFERAVLAWERGEKVKVLFIVPPRCGKSELISRNGAPWIVGRNPERTILALSLSQNFASDIGESVLDAIQSEEYQGTFPGVKLSKRSQSKKDFKIESDEAPDIEPTPSEAASSEAGQEGEGVASGELIAGRGRRKRGRYVSYGVGGNFTGRDADGLICDDLIDERAADNPTLMAKAHRAVRALRNRFNPAGKWFWFVVMTRDNDDDVAALLQRDFSGDGPWRVIEVPLIAEERTVIEVPHTPSGFGGTWVREVGDVLAPYTADEAYARRESMLTTRPHEWYGRYQCRPAPATGNMVDPVNLRAYTPSPVTISRRSYFRVALSVDTGEGKKADSARTAIGAYGEMIPACNPCETCGGGERRTMCPECKGSGLGHPVKMLELQAHPWQLPDQIAVVKAMARRHRPDVILIEDKSTGFSLAQALRRDTDWPRCLIQLEGCDGDKIVRMSRALPVINDWQIALPTSAIQAGLSWQGVGADIKGAWPSDLRAELLQFPRGRFKDRCDQLSQYVNWRTLNPLALPRGVSVGPAQPERGIAEQSKRVSEAIAGRAFEAF